MISVCRYVFPLVHPALGWSICLQACSILLLIRPPTRPSVCLSVRLRLTARPTSVFPYVCVCVCFTACLSVHLSVCVCLTTSLSVRVCVFSPPVRPSVCLSVCVCITRLPVCPSVCISCLSVSPSVRPCISLSVCMLSSHQIRDLLGCVVIDSHGLVPSFFFVLPPDPSGRGQHTVQVVLHTSEISTHKGVN